MSDTPDPPPLSVPIPPDLVATDPVGLRWGTVSTIRAPLRAIARFAAWHLDLGAHRINIYLDDPDPRIAEFFTPFKRVRITLCDAAYWAKKSKKARQSHQLRQAFNATRCYGASRLDWLAHIDVDEFLLPDRPLADLLAETPADTAFVRMRPAEMLAQPDPWSGPAHFKLTGHEAGRSRADLDRLYPEFGAYVPEGFLSYTGAKNIARVGLPEIRFGIHGLFQQGRKIKNGHTSSELHVGHAHAPSWEVFRTHLEFRMSKGSYRRKERESMKLEDVLSVIQDAEGESGLRRFFDEITGAGPQRLAQLQALDMLLTRQLDADARVARRFGDLPPGA